MRPPFTVEEIVPLVEALPPQERARVLRLITTKLRPDDALFYVCNPPVREDDPLEWEGECWEHIP